jgi:glutaredoxin
LFRKGFLKELDGFSGTVSNVICYGSLFEAARHDPQTMAGNSPFPPSSKRSRKEAFPHALLDDRSQRSNNPTNRASGFLARNELATFMFGWRKSKTASLPETQSAEVIVYTRSGCHLCDDAKKILERHGLNPQLVDIDADPELQTRFNECVPVVVIDGRESFRGRVNEVLLRRMLKRRPA